MGLTARGKCVELLDLGKRNRKCESQRDVIDLRNFAQSTALLTAFDSRYHRRPEWQHIGNQIDAAFITALAHFVSLDAHKQPDVPKKA